MAIRAEEGKGAEPLKNLPHTTPGPRLWGLYRTQSWLTVQVDRTVRTTRSSHNGATGPPSGFAKLKRRLLLLPFAQLDEAPPRIRGDAQGTIPIRVIWVGWQPV